MQIDKPLIVYIPDTRGVQVSRYGRGNLKIGPNVFTYSRLPGLPEKAALGSGYLDNFVAHRDGMMGTCPGSTEECREICYAARPVEERGAVAAMWRINSNRDDVPPLPADAKLLRLHVSGDFDSNAYITNWRMELTLRSDVKAWVYTRSWRVPALLADLEELRALPNVQMFASMDASTPELPPAGWRRAWIDGDVRAGLPTAVVAHEAGVDKHNIRTADGTMSLICPEETGRQPNCETCGYCQDGRSKDVTFLRH